MILLSILYQIFIGIVNNIKQYQKQNLCLTLLSIVQYKTISNKTQQYQTKLKDNTQSQYCMILFDVLYQLLLDIVNNTKQYNETIFQSNTISDNT